MGCLFISSVRGQNFLEISGKVTGVESGEPLPGAVVQIEKTLLADVCDEQGEFHFARLSPAVYWLKITFIGYTARKIRVDLTKKRNTRITVALSPSPIQMNQIIVTGSRQPEDLEAAVASVSVLEGREIRTHNDFRLDQALLRVAGVTLVGENINVRGGSGYNRLGGSRILVLVDDVPILTSDLSNVNWNLIPLTAVDHVEVLKGAASSLYGSGALSGAINILTRKPGETPRFWFRQCAGIYDTPSVPQWKWTDRILYYHRSDLGFSTNLGSVGLRFDAAYHRSTGDREMGQLKRWYFSGKSSVLFHDQSKLTFFFTYSYENRDLFLRWLRQNDALRVPPSDKDNHFQLHGFVGYAVYQKLFSSTLSSRLRISYNQQLLGLPFHLTSAFRPALGFSAEWKLNWLPHPDHRVTAGVDFKRDQVEAHYYGKRTANGWSPYIQEIWKISQIWQMNAGLRLDTYTLVGDSVETQVSPRVGFSYQPRHGSIVHVSWGRGFRAASVVERYLNVDTGGDIRVVANPSLPPERSWLFDAGIRQIIGHSFFAEITAFRSVYQNFIELTLLPRTLNVQYRSFPKAKIDGVETSLRWRFWHDRIGLKATATWMDARFVRSGDPLPYRPRFFAFVTPGIYLGPLGLETDWQYSSKLERVLIFPRDERVPTQIYTLRMWYKWHNFSFIFIIHNLMNYNYTISERVLGEIRNYSFTLVGRL